VIVGHDFTLFEDTGVEGTGFPAEGMGSTGRSPLQGVHVRHAHALLPLSLTGVLTRPLPIFRNTNFRISPKILDRPEGACTCFRACFCDVFAGFGDVRLLVM
jgi:hypothetical protein